MSKHQLEERRTKRRAITAGLASPASESHVAELAPPSGKLARGTRDIAKIAEARRPQTANDEESDHDTIVVDPDDSHVDGEVLDTLDLDGDDASIDAHMLELGKRRFGISYFRPGQALAIRNVLAGIDTLAIMPTGAGKSLCYQLPALELDGVTLVVSPLIALMKDQIDLLARLGVDAARLDSSLGADEVRAVSGRLRAGTLELLYVAPERFNNERFLTELARTKIALFAVDEAHCYLGVGPQLPTRLPQARRAGA